MKDLIYVPLNNKKLDLCEVWEINKETLKALDNKARNLNQLVGRYIEHPHGDGYATYQIIKENKNTVKIEICLGLGDDWILPAWGKTATIKKGLAMLFIQQRDTFAKLMNQNKV